MIEDKITRTVVYVAEDEVASELVSKILTLSAQDKPYEYDGRIYRILGVEINPSRYTIKASWDLREIKD